LFIEDDIILLGVEVILSELTTHSMMPWSLLLSGTKEHTERGSVLAVSDAMRQRDRTAFNGLAAHAVQALNKAIDRAEGFLQ
jgi:hypothetical protein